jgi:hypothetical protein
MVVYLLIIGSLFFHQKKQQRLRAMTLNVIITASKKILVLKVRNNYGAIQLFIFPILSDNCTESNTEKKH